MLQNIRENAQGTIAKGIIAVLILSLSVWGLDAIVGGSGESEMATVDGEAITETQFQRLVQIERQQRLSEMDDPDPSLIDDQELNESVLESLIREKLLGQDVARRGLELTDQDIDQMITQAEQFQVNGQFSQERFTQAVRNQGMTVDEFREMLERDHLTRIMQAVIQGSAFSSTDESRRLAQLLTQTRSFSTLELKLEEVEEVSVSDEEIEQFYDENRDLFKQEESADVSWITLRREDLIDTDEVEDSDVRDLYEQRYVDEDGAEERNAAHILISDGEDADEKVEAVTQGLEDGESFSSLAEQYSDDTGTAGNGGELGYADFDAYDEAFSEALFGIESEEEWVGPVETSFGQHFIKLLSVRSEEPPEFEEVEDELRRDVATERAGRRFVELSEELADLAYAEYDLEAPAELIGQEIQERDGVTPEGSDAPFDHPALIRQLFSEDVLEGGFNTELVELGSDEAVVARVREYYPETQLDLDEVRDEVRERVAAEKRREQLEEKLSEWAERLREDGDDALESVADEAGVEWRHYSEVERDELEVPAILRDGAFRLARPGDRGFSVGVVELPEGLALVKLDEVHDADEATVNAVAGNLTQSLNQRHGQSAYHYYVDQLRSEAEVERR